MDGNLKAFSEAVPTIDYQDIFENNPLGLFYILPDGTIRDLNARARKLMGSPSKNESCTLNLLKFERFSEYGIAQLFKKAVETRKVVEGKLHYPSKWGQNNYLRFVFKPQLVADEVSYVMVVIEKMDKPLKLATLSKKLLNRLTERAELDRRINKIKKNFFAQISHEMRTPINAIIGLADLLEQELCREITPAQHEHFVNIGKSANHLLEMVNDILDYEKIRSGEMFVNKISFSLKELLENAVKYMRIIALEKKIEIELDLPNEPLNVFADPKLIRHAVYNLLTNAIKYNARNSKTGVRAWPTVTGYGIEVWDNGIGIPQSEREKIFTPFGQASNRSRSEVGTGLGLYIVKNIIEAHGGKLELKSKIGQGSKFTMELPGLLVSNATVFAKETQVLQKILIVEDHEISIKIIKKMFLNSGHELCFAKTSQEALSLLDGFAPSMILMDINLAEGSEYSGKELITVLRNDKNLQVPIIAQSAGELPEYQSLGFNDFIAKPLKKNDLLELVGKHSIVEKTTKDRKIDGKKEA